MLAVVHNITAATRLLDVLELVAGDPRIQTVFTCPGSSAFTAGTEEFLAARGIPTLPWAQAASTAFDVAIAASYGGDLHELRAPLIVVPHGMGYNKYLENRKSKIENRLSVFGLSAPWLMFRGEVVPAQIVLSHEEQLDRLRTSCPPAAGRAIVAGDPCLDRLRTSRVLRETYRQALGVREHQRLVVLTSTWGEASLLGRHPDLPRRLATRLPLDTHRLAVALHPNITQGHSAWQVERWLDDCRRAGVLVLPSEELWQPALVAADLTIGDHGSVTFYSACLGTPLLLAATPEGTVDPASPIAQLLRSAPRLDVDADPLPQFDRTIAEHDPGRYADITDLATSLPGKSAEILRALLYRTASLDPPAHPAGPRLLPTPAAALPEPTATLVTTEPFARYPVDVRREPARLSEGHLVVHTDEPDAGLLELADVVLGDAPADPLRWLAETLHALPGCRWAATAAGERWLAASRDGRVVEVHDLTGPPRALISLLAGYADPPTKLEIAGYSASVRPFSRS